MKIKAYFSDLWIRIYRKLTAQLVSDICHMVESSTARDISKSQKTILKKIETLEVIDTKPQVVNVTAEVIANGKRARSVQSHGVVPKGLKLPTLYEVRRY